MEILQIQNLDVKPFLNRLESIFADMDRVYSEAAAHYGFNCHGCEDNCCRTRFYHHTYIEYLFIQEGVRTLGRKRQMEVKSSALKICKQSTELDKNRKPVRLMCPLNIENLCILYAHRPMICRLHGIPHELRKSADNPTSGPGCRTFDRRCRGKSYIAFDRTPIYLKLAALENEFKHAAGITGKIKLTIAEMLSSMALQVESKR
jgi:Fe-S-cluster containining protein